MATTNQKHIAEALRLARDEYFEAGLRHFQNNVRGVSPEVQRKWFINKCVEHHIRVPIGSSEFIIQMGVATEKFKEGMIRFGKAVSNAAKLISDANARANAEVAVHDPSTW